MRIGLITPFVNRRSVFTLENNAKLFLKTLSFLFIYFCYDIKDVKLTNFYTKTIIIYPFLKLEHYNIKDIRMVMVCRLKIIYKRRIFNYMNIFSTIQKRYFAWSYAIRLKQEYKRIFLSTFLFEKFKIFRIL